MSQYFDHKPNKFWDWHISTHQETKTPERVNKCSMGSLNGKGWCQWEICCSELLHIAGIPNTNVLSINYKLLYIFDFPIVSHSWVQGPRVGETFSLIADTGGFDIKPAPSWGAQIAFDREFGLYIWTDKILFADSEVKIEETLPLFHSLTSLSIRPRLNLCNPTPLWPCSKILTNHKV